MRANFLILSLLTIIISCKKDLILPSGNYIGNFYGDVVEYDSGKPSGQTHNSTSIHLVISNINDNSIDINGITLDKRGDIIEGVIYVSDDYAIQPVISGTIKKEKKAYSIEGVYKATLMPYWQEEYDVFGGYVGGDFSIKME